jgi:hypothetical protein
MLVLFKKWVYENSVAVRVSLAIGLASALTSTHRSETVRTTAAAGGRSIITLLFAPAVRGGRESDSSRDNPTTAKRHEHAGTGEEWG